LVHPQTSLQELDELSSLLQVPLAAGTVNRGSDIISAGLIANDWTAFCGLDTTSTELNVIEEILKIRSIDNNKSFESTRAAIIDTISNVFHSNSTLSINPYSFASCGSKYLGLFISFSTSSIDLPVDVDNISSI